MGKIARAVQYIFGSTAGNSGITKFGSTAAGSTVYSTDIKTIQSGAAWASGWLGAVLSGTKRKPVYQDQNAINYVFSTQIANILQDGIPVYNADTVYYIGCICRKDGTSELYKSLANDNTGNLLTDGTKWQFLGDLSSLGSTSELTFSDTITHSDSPYQLSDGEWVNVDSTAGAVTVVLPTSGKCKVKWTAGTNAVTVQGTIDGETNYVIPVLSWAVDFASSADDTFWRV